MRRPAELILRRGLDLLIVVTAAVTATATVLREDLEHPSGPLFVLAFVGITSAVLVCQGTFLTARRRS